jgi:hypothetical protein
MKQFLIALLVVASLALVGKPGVVSGADQRDDLLMEKRAKAPWLQHRMNLYRYRLAVENPPESIRQELFKSCFGEIMAAEREHMNVLAASSPDACSSKQLGRYDPFVQVPQTDSLCTHVNTALNTVSNRILMVWQDERNGYEDPDIFGQIFDLTYALIGQNIKINPAGIKAAQIAPDVCALSDGRFLVSWEDYATSTPQVLAQVVRQDGTLQGAAVKVAPLLATPQYFPKVDSYGDSTHVTWLQKDEKNYEIYIRTLNLLAVPQAPAVRVNDDDASTPWIPGIANFGDGQTAIVWQDKRDGNSEIYAQIYKADGVKRGDNFLVNTDPFQSIQRQPAVAGNSGMMQVVWEDYQNGVAAIYAQQFDRFALPVGDNFRLDQLEVLGPKESPHLSINEQGQRIFAWQENSSAAWRLKFALYPAASDVPIYFALGESDALHEYTDIMLDQAKSSIYFAFLGQPIGGKSTVLSHKVTFTSVPVELASFQATVHSSTVRLAWQTASETNNLGFAVERMREGERYERIAFVFGMGTTCECQQYGYEDKELAPGKYHYRLRQIDLDGTGSLSEEIVVAVQGPEQLELLAAYPNPFKEQTNLAFRLPETSGVRVLVYNLLGQQVRQIASGTFVSGQHLLNWDGRDDAGLQLPAGQYLLKTQMGKRIEIRRLAIVR